MQAQLKSLRNNYPEIFDNKESSMIVKIAKAAFVDQRLSPKMTAYLRAAIASNAPTEVALHHHQTDGKLLYRYPLIQYKVLKGIPIIIAINECIPLLVNILMRLDEIRIGNSQYQVYEKKMDFYEQEFGDTEEMHSYRFVSPWMGLNQQNYTLYNEENSANRKIRLQKNIVNNLISVSKSLGFTVTKQLSASLQEKSIEVNFKNNLMLCFTGNFSVNFKIPDYIGIGKSVSRGFGTIIKETSVKEENHDRLALSTGKVLS